MKKSYKLILSVILFLSATTVNSQQNSTSLTVQLSATVVKNPSKIILNWINDGTAVGGQGYKVFRRIVGSGNSWGNHIAGLSASSSQFIDNNITIGINYEYHVRKNSGGSYGHGYINSSIELPVIENRGKIILVVEDTYIGNIDFDLAVDQTIIDIEADGWVVKRLNVNRNDAVTSVKQSIVTIYNQDITNTKGLYLLGHIPVPYSGLICPDGHPSTHLGAWPADVYYGDMDGVWTDNTVNDVTAIRSENHNIPGDGKFDQSVIPSRIELQIGRVDLSNLTSFSNTEEELLVQYLNKAHDYKTKSFTANDRSLIDNNFTSYQEGFASSGYRNFSVMFDSQNIHDTLDYFDATSLSSGESYMWSYGCGGGTYSSCGGIGNTSDFSVDDLQSIFTMLFGSYFGDWDCEDNLLRASIAQGQTLCSAWAGRPHWQFHHMALGSNIGRSTRVSQNNNGRYFSSTYTNFYKRKVHIALMGDPTLRMHYVDPPENLTTLNDNNQVALNWTPSQDIIEGYNVYRILPGENDYTKVNNALITSTAFTDNSISFNADITYIVKAVEIKTSASGSYFNQSLGATSTTSVVLGLEEFIGSNISISPNPSNNLFNIDWGSQLNGNVKIQVYNINGQVVSEELTNDSRYSLYSEQFPNGIYFVKLTDNSGKSYTEKIIKF